MSDRSTRMVEGIPNRDVGNAWLVFILGELYAAWPRKMDFDSMSIVRDTCIAPRADEEAFFDDLAEWLVDEGYIRFKQSGGEGSALDVSLTEKGHKLLLVQQEDAKPLGQKMKDVMKDIAKEGVTTAKSEIIAQIVGGLIGSAMKSFATS